MKKLVLSVMLVGAVASLAACSSTDQGKKYPAPYAHERTAGGTTSAEPVFERTMKK